MVDKESWRRLLVGARSYSKIAGSESASAVSGSHNAGRDCMHRSGKLQVAGPRLAKRLRQGRLDGKSERWGGRWRKKQPVDMKLARAIRSSKGTPEVPILVCRSLKSCHS